MERVFYFWELKDGRLLETGRFFYIIIRTCKTEERSLEREIVLSRENGIYLEDHFSGNGKRMCAIQKEDEPQGSQCTFMAL